MNDCIFCHGTVVNTKNFATVSKFDCFKCNVEFVISNNEINTISLNGGKYPVRVYLAADHIGIWSLNIRLPITWIFPHTVDEFINRVMNLLVFL